MPQTPADTPSDLILATRPGLPDEVAYLRAAYPKPQWRSHANFGELTAFWLQVHDSLRAHGQHVSHLTQDFRERRRDVASFQREWVPAINQFLQHLNAHHQIEDQAYFPKFRSLDPRMVAGFELLENDHGVIHEQLVASVDRARDLLAALAENPGAAAPAADAYAAASDQLLALLLRHLADEEDLVVPAMLEHGERSVS
jgi:iron-sulfur cluster repair protein YtfE (RIC family)